MLLLVDRGWHLASVNQYVCLCQKDRIKSAIIQSPALRCSAECFTFLLPTQWLPLLRRSHTMEAQRWSPAGLKCLSLDFCWVFFPPTYHPTRFCLLINVPSGVYLSFFSREFLSGNMRSNNQKKTRLGAR